MNTNNDITGKIEAVKLALVDHLRTAEDDQLKDFEVISISHRSFSTIVYLKIATSKVDKRLVMKTVEHHPINKEITDRENQAVIEYNLLKFLHPKFEAVEGCSVPRPILAIPEIETYVMEFVEGNLLADKLRYARYFSPKDKFETLKKYYFYCGRWLNYFQKFTGMHIEDLKSLLGIIDRCDYRLKLIEELNDPRCPKDLRKRVNDLLHEQFKRSETEKILVSGRHGDFGPWNIIVGPSGVTVIDYLGYEEDTVSFDIIKMLITLEDERRYLTSSPMRIKEMKKSFLEGYGPLPSIAEPALIICEAFHRVCVLLASLSNSSGHLLHHRIEIKKRLKQNIKWFTDNRSRKLLWPI